jgi:hypothetical protein
MSSSPLSRGVSRQSSIPESCNNSEELHVERAPVCKWYRQKPTTVLWKQLLRLSARWPLALGFLYELGSFQNRIVLMRKERWYGGGGRFGPTLQGKSDPTPRDRRQILGYIQDTRNIDRSLPWLSMSDSWLIRLGWDRGAEWGLCYRDTEGQGIEQELSK